MSKVNEWQEDFVKKVGVLRDDSARKFERIAGDIVEPVYHEFAEFIARCDFQTSVPRTQKGLRTVKFALTEDVYVLISFRLRGFDAVDCDYELFVPPQGRADGPRSTVGLHRIDRPWVEECFQTALDDFVAKCSDGLRPTPVAEPVTV